MPRPPIQLEPLTDAEKSFVEANMRLVYKYTNKFWMPRGIPREEIESVGMMALIRATKKYYPTTRKFSTILYVVMRTQVLRFIEKEQREMRFPTVKPTKGKP